MQTLIEVKKGVKIIFEQFDRKTNLIDEGVFFMIS